MVAQWDSTSRVSHHLRRHEVFEDAVHAGLLHTLKVNHLAIQRRLVLLVVSFLALQLDLGGLISRSSMRKT